MTYLAPTTHAIAPAAPRAGDVVPGVAVCPRCGGYYVGHAYLTVVGTDFNGEVSDPNAAAIPLALWDCRTCGYVGPISEVTS